VNDQEEAPQVFRIEIKFMADGKTKAICAISERAFLIPEIRTLAEKYLMVVTEALKNTSEISDEVNKRYWRGVESDE
jgi:hypothetical protein